ncbi:DUF89 domain-containing protein [Stereum hirsutum FP-91666 SS1]|uniref:DUF89 domain-containing protein n=1 Tax=Stereum hirsutum (strain FP-91666) TaxID=721885 RepID=UPI000444A105|nr:DUF89 domain-containing protein [Stereum hirsutum FP-91666 SS1]EIM84187.1 DUF89 domain-containing protein [Stereum hirsutum FP-91666 SS1]
MYEAPYPPYDPVDTSGFSYQTVVKRWPVILTGIIDTIYRTNHDLSLSSDPDMSKLGDVSAVDQETRERIEEGKRLIEKLSKLKYEMGRDRPLEAVPDDGEPLVKVYNDELEKLSSQGKGTWFTAPWLYAECYLYRFLRAYFSRTKYWRTFDPFRGQKESTFQASGTAIYQLATTMHELEAEKSALISDPDKLVIIFREMIQMCLWGNATDLSLLTHMSHSDIQDLQTVGKDAQAARKEFILKDDQERVWDHIKTLSPDSRVDFVLDNAGFELFTDFVFADFLVTYTPYVSRVVFHPKIIPWFVSDVTPTDFKQTFASLLSPAFFPSSPTASSKPSPSQQHLHAMVLRWQSYLENGIFALSVPLDTPLGGDVTVGTNGQKNVVVNLEKNGVNEASFWTGPWPYWDMKELAPELWTTLSESGLVIFKGDLNYRKLTGDIKWPVSTPFEIAVGPLAGSFPLLSLRTNKADVAVGVPQAVADELDKKGEKWRVSGKYALVSFIPKGSQA